MAVTTESCGMFCLHCDFVPGFGLTVCPLEIQSISNSSFESGAFSRGRCSSHRDRSDHRKDQTNSGYTEARRLGTEVTENYARDLGLFHQALPLYRVATFAAMEGVKAPLRSSP
jgi:hypothetical protein